MKITLKRLWDSQDALATVLKFELDGAKALCLQKLVQVVSKELDALNSVKNTLLEKHGSKDKQGNFTIKAGDKGYNALMKKFTEALDHEVEIEEIDKAQLSTADLSGNKISTQKLLMLDWLII